MKSSAVEPDCVRDMRVATTTGSGHMSLSNQPAAARNTLYEMRPWAVLAGLIVWLASAPTLAGTPSPIAQVVAAEGTSITGKVNVLRAGKPVEFQPYMLLYTGDKITIGDPNVKLEIFSMKDRARIEISGTYTIGAGSVGSGSRVTTTSAAFPSWSALWNALIPTAGYDLPVAMKTRGSENAPHYLGLLPDAPQYLPPSQNHIALLWAGAPTNWKVTYRGGRTAALPKTTMTWLDASIQPGAISEIVNDTGTVHWMISDRAEAAAPRPAFLPQRGPLTPTDRALRAAWLLTRDEQHWRLFALSELAELSETDFVALRYWRAVLTGAWPPRLPSA